jgi:flagellin
MRINTNVASLTAQEANVQVNKDLNDSLAKLSSGLRINKAADDASGMSIADKLRTQASALGQAISNANSGSALIQIADKAMAEQSNILDIIKSKLIQAGTSTTSTEGREAIRKDVTKLLDQLDSIATGTNYNGINLLNVKGQTFTFHIGESGTDQISTSTAYASNTGGLGGGANKYTAAQTIDAQGAININVSSTATDANNLVTVAQKTTGTTGDRAVDVSADNVLTLNFAGTNVNDAITFTVGDDATRNIMIAAAGGHSELSYVAATETFTLTDTALTGGATITFASVVDLGTLSVSGLAAGTGGESLTFKNTLAAADADSKLGTVTVSNKNTDSGTPTADTITVSGTGVEDLTGGELLSSLKGLDTDELTSEKANGFLSSVDEALNQLNAVRSDFGSTQNQLESSIRNMATTQTNIKAAESVIRDVDYAAESANFNKQNIIAQAGTYALSQANQVQQNVLRLLQ